jgi:hypothetical protein
MDEGLVGPTLYRGSCLFIPLEIIAGTYEGRNGIWGAEFFTAAWRLGGKLLGRCCT